MDANNQNGGEKKAQLSWSQPLTTSTQKTEPQNKPGFTPSSTKKSQAPVQKSNTFRNVGIIVALLAVVGIGWATFASKSKAPETEKTAAAWNNSGNAAGTTTGSSLQDGSVTIPSPQDAGLEITVANVRVSVPTWIVVYENYNGQPGNVLGAALFTSGRTSGAVDLLRGTLPGQTYFVGEARDDGDHKFSMANDPAVRDANGNPLWVKFETK